MTKRRNGVVADILNSPPALQSAAKPTYGAAQLSSTAPRPSSFSKGQMCSVNGGTCTAQGWVQSSTCLFTTIPGSFPSCPSPNPSAPLPGVNSHRASAHFASGPTAGGSLELQQCKEVHCLPPPHVLSPCPSPSIPKPTPYFRRPKAVAALQDRLQHPQLNCACVCR